MNYLNAQNERLATYWEARPHRSGIDLDTLEADLAEVEQRQEAAQTVSEVDGQHYSAHRDRIMALQRSRALQEALELCERCIAATRWQSRIQGSVEAPWFTERASTLLGRLGRTEEARGVLREYVSRYPEDRPPGKIHARLEKLR